MEPENIKDILDGVNFKEVIHTITNNKENVANMVQQSSSQLTPEMMDQARKYASGTQGEQIKQELNRQGAANKTTLQVMLKQKKLYSQINNNAKGEAKKVVLITTSKQIKNKEVHKLTLEAEAKRLVGSDDALEISCSRMSVGPLLGKTIKAWYSPGRKGFNNLASSMVGFNIAGELLLIMEEGNLLESDVRDAKKYLM